MIANQLEKISITADALNLWVSDTIASGKIDKEKFELIRNEKRSIER